MKVVIDIPKNDYKLACNYPEALIDCYARYIKNGTPLPEKHGRLIDADALVPDICRDWEGGRVPPDYYSEECIRNAPTVIEAEGV